MRAKRELMSGMICMSVRIKTQFHNIAGRFGRTSSISGRGRVVASYTLTHSRVRPGTPHIAVWLRGGEYSSRAVDGKHGLRAHGALGGDVSERSCAGGGRQCDERRCKEGAEELHG